MSGSRFHGIGFRVFIRVALLEYDLPLWRGTPRILPKVLKVRVYRVSLYLCFTSRWDNTLHEKKEIISEERKCEYSIQAEAKSKYAGKAVFSWQLDWGGSIPKDWVGVLVGYRRGYVGHSGQTEGRYLNFEKYWCVYAGVAWFLRKKNTGSRVTRHLTNISM